MCWCNPAYEARWKDIELSSMDIPIQSVLGCTSRVNQALQLQNQFVVFSLGVWLEVVKRFQLHGEIGVLSWPAYDPRFLPASQDYRFRQWARRGITAFCQILTNGRFNSFEDLCQVYELGKEDFYRYLQIQHFFLKEIRPPDPAEPSVITQIFVDAYKSKNMKGIIGKLYKGFSLMNKNSTNYIRERWEKETNMVISEDVWLQIWETLPLLTPCFGGISVGKTLPVFYYP